ncbi:MAG TPA: hypothetical protein PKD88_12275 [Nitrosomonas sp.]|nr:hypothetical protein [Nitrosomonas sp.]HMW21764.1 hypothetical protein [Nitrosomonas sp.]HMW70100.1 hypothetical protein [Nitrosomonas sp.]HMY62618.1 hypothetical protein [Nitrosomonas sp.]HMY91326.1 hypothetical protein [Nitrosomonas sp.]
MDNGKLEMDENFFSQLSREQLERMAEAGAQIIECYRVLQKAGLNVVGEVLKGQGEFYELEHYPKDDVYDGETHSQYYYHAHRSETNENGHFHTFLRQPGMPAGIFPIPYSGTESWPEGKDALSHLIGISMDAYGFPLGLFATNRWVTAEAWYKSEDVISMLDHFKIDHAYPSWPVNQWISAMLILFRPQIEALLRQRDQVITERARKHQGIDVFEERSLELTGYLPINVEQQIKYTVAVIENHNFKA